MQVGFVGLGNMGGPLAERLVGQVPLALHDLDPARARALAGEEAVVHEDVRALAASVDVLLTCLPASSDVEALFFGEHGIAGSLRRGTVVADMTTGDPAMTRAMAERLADAGVTLVDAPVSGGPRGAREGTIAIMVGGDPSTFERLAPVLGHISVNVVHVGDTGAGHAIKAGNNLLNLICRLATLEVVSLLVRDGVDPARAVETIQKSSGRNYATEVTLPDNILSGTMRQGFTTGLMHKDSGVALDIARAHGLAMPFGQMARETLERTVAEYGRDADMSTVALTTEAETGARIRPADD